MLLNLDWGKGWVQFNMISKMILPKFNRHIVKRLFFFKSFQADIAQFGVKPLEIVINFKPFKHLINTT